MQQTQEPSVEDILRSIRNVVGSREDGAAPPRPAAPAAGEGDGSGGGEGVLELTDVLEIPGEGDDSDGGQPLLAPERQAAIRDSLQAFAALAAPGAAEGIARSAETSLDSLTRELLRPMMAEWLDRNLPPLVEKLLKAEIARIAGRAG